MSDFFEKYDLPVPRYTSYPTVPTWGEPPALDSWIQHVRDALKGAGWSMYLHVPYCESLCTFCGCNNVITRDHGREEPYVRHVLAEWESYRRLVPELEQAPLRHLHIGGGSPTFLGPDSFRAMVAPILAGRKGFEASIEVDPRTSTQAKMEAYREMGFTRVSLGVQDFNEEVQRLVNRRQPFGVTAEVVRQARALKFSSVNFDLIYGLPRQTPELMRRTTELTLELRPDRIALYSFALVPWIKPQQRLFKDTDLPRREEKWNLYRVARSMLLDAGYLEVGMDHFALPSDSLARAMVEGRLHRNFMGYTDQRTDLLLGLGVSSISETPWSFHQNEKVVNLWEQRVLAGEVPTHRGHVLTPEDREQREKILTLMTRFRVPLTQPEEVDAREFLGEMLADGLVVVQDGELRVTDSGRPFLRNAATFFDLRLRRSPAGVPRFSRSI